MTKSPTFDEIFQDLIRLRKVGKAKVITELDLNEIERRHKEINSPEFFYHTFSSMGSKDKGLE